MKINFDGYNQNPNVSKAATSQEKASFYQTDKAGAYALDISGTVMDNTAYGVHGRTTEDVMQNADAQLNVDVQRDYMTVMSNSMSTEDYNKMAENGFHPEDMDPEQAVTIVDHIKASMAQAGEVVAGYNDDLSSEKLSALTGNEGYAREIENALKQADASVNRENTEDIQKAVEISEEITQFPDAAKKYMVENSMAPTLENIYYAAYSAGNSGEKQAKGYYAQECSGYYAKKAEEINWTQLAPQLEKTIREMNLPTEESGQDGETSYMESAKWLVEEGIPVTREALLQLRELQRIQIPMDTNTVITAAAEAVSQGKAAAKADLSSNSEGIYNQAAKLCQAAQQISEDAVEAVVEKEQELNLQNLFSAQEQMNQGENTNGQQTKEDSLAVITAKRQLAQVQLQMTVSANIKLLKSNYAIDTVPLNRLVEDLKKQEEALKKQFFGGETSQEIDTRAALYQNTSSVLEKIPFLPAAVIGRMALEEGNTLSYVHETGTRLKTQYEAVGESYETLMTAPRRDMGDSIQKAFRNVDDILSDMGLELTDENRKAVRILGYNNMEITQDALKKVKLADKQVENIVKSMTPAKTIALIREGVNTLTENLEELESRLQEMEQQPQEETKKYSRFLYELEQNQEITEAQRGAYIGVYRLFHQIEKSDGAAVGNLVATGGELTLGNLLSAVRSEKAKKMDVTVDESFGMLSETVAKGTSISGQIEEGVLEVRLSRAETHEIYRDITVKGLQEAGVDENTTVAELAAGIRQAAQTGSQKTVQDIHTDLTKAAQTRKEIYQYLEMYEQPVTAENLLAADALANERGSLFSQAKKYLGKIREAQENGSSAAENAFDEEVDRVLSEFTGREEAARAYEQLVKTTGEILSEAADYGVDNTLDLKTLSSCHKQLSLAAGLSQRENYELPVIIGDTLTAVNLTIVHDGEEKGCVSITFHTEECGKTGAKLYLNGDKTEVLLVTQKEENLEKLKELGSAFCDSLTQQGKEPGQISCSVSKELNLLTFPERMTDNHTVDISTKELYGMAKQFLTDMQTVFS